ncbi:MAG: DUF3105 domain-containing protein [Deltaproteobacteria bacterium]|nr:DUF3105 domain-containing protein [Deltaproteobacteria bacterium]
MRCYTTLIAALLALLTLSACATDSDADGPIQLQPEGSADTTSDGTGDTEPADTTPQDVAADTQGDEGSADTSDGSGSGDTGPDDASADTTDGSGSGDTGGADTSDDTTADTDLADTTDDDVIDDTTDTTPDLDATDTTDTTPPRVWVLPCDAGCPTGLTCDETGYCRRAVVAETYAEGSGDPTSGVSLSNLALPDPAGTTPDIAPLDCNGTTSCLSPFVCNTDGSCTAPCTACGGACDYESLNYASRNHIQTDLLYAGTPAGGSHHLCWAPWGISTTPVGDEHWVHNLEHGGVAFLYRCTTDCSSEVAQLTDYVSTLPVGTAVMSPEPMLNQRFTVVAWGYRLETDCLDLAAFEAFYIEHQGHGPEATTMPPPPQCL